MEALPWWGLPLIFALLEGALCSCVGTVLLTQRRILQANLIANGVLPGLAIAVALQLDPAIGGWVSGLAAALVSERLIRSHQQQQEAVQNTVLAGALAIGVLLLALLGIILVIALLCAPAVVGLNQASSLSGAMVRASAIGSSCSLGGFGLALLLDLPPGPVIGLLCLLLLWLPKPDQSMN